MPKLILSMDGLVLKEVFLTKERTTIGRKPSNDIQIDNLAISGEHAVITTILNDAFLEDRDSTNGTHVNGQPVHKYALKHNDVIELGKYRLKYIADDFRRNPDADSIDSGELGSSVPAGSPPSPFLNEAALAPGEPRPRAGSKASEGPVGVIQVLSGPNAGRELRLTKSLASLGKPGVQVAVITRRSDGYFVTHLEGDGPTVINGAPIGEQAVRLREHDIIEIGGVKMEFFLRG